MASTSRGAPGPSPSRSGTTAANLMRTATRMAEPGPHIPMPSARPNHGLAEGASDVIAVREGAAIPEGYALHVRAPAPTHRPSNEMVDLTTPPDPDANQLGEDADNRKRQNAERKKASNRANKLLQSSFVKEVKESLAEGRPPVIQVREDETHLKARWHAAAKDCAYRILDLRKEGWKEYTKFEKEKVHRELNKTYKFDPPIDPKRVNTYLSDHLRSSRAVWKAHWQRYGDDNRHPNCPEEAWDSLIQWWPTEACREVSAEMASRRSKVQKSSTSGRKQLVHRMADEVRHAHSAWYYPDAHTRYVYYAARGKPAWMTCANSISPKPESWLPTGGTCRSHPEFSSGVRTC